MSARQIALAQGALLALGGAALAASLAWPHALPGEGIAARLAPVSGHLAHAWDAVLTARGAPAPADPSLTAAARRHALAALAQRPASGYAWTALAWAEHLAGRPDAALAALRASWRVTPHLRAIAPARVELGKAYWPMLDAAARAHLLDEINLARQADATRFRDASAGDARLAALWRLAEMRLATRAWERKPDPAAPGGAPAQAGRTTPPTLQGRAP